MNLFRKIAIFGLLLTFLVGNIGFAIYTHSCSLSGKQQSFFVQTSDPCEALHKEDKISGCCEKEKHEESKESVSNDCCTTDARLIKVTNDLSANNFLLKAVISSQIWVPELISTIEPALITRTSENKNFVHPPPKYQGRKLQSVNQVFII